MEVNFGQRSVGKVSGEPMWPPSLAKVLFWSSHTLKGPGIWQLCSHTTGLSLERGRKRVGSHLFLNACCVLSIVKCDLYVISSNSHKSPVIWALYYLILQGGNT